MRLIRLLKNDLAEEVKSWEADGLIEPEQTDAILLRYGIRRGESSTFAYDLLMGLGFLFVGLALITLIGANWDEIPRWLRMSGLITLTALTQVLAVWLWQRQEPSKAVGTFFLGNIFYGASIVLIAQVYHLGEHMPDGIFLWALGCLPLAVLTASRLLALQMLVLAMIWCWVESSLGFYPALLPIFLIATAYVLIQSKGSLLLFMGLFFGFGIWLESSLAAYWQSGSHMIFEAEHLIVTVSFMAAAYRLSYWLNLSSESIYRDYGAVLNVWALRFVLILLFVLSFDEPWEELINASWDHVPSMTLVSAAFWAVALFLGAKNDRFLPTLAAFILLTVLTSLTVWVEQDVQAILFQIASNVALVSLGVALVLRGIKGNATHYFWTGVVTILVVALVRYIDLVGDYIGGALLFAVIACVLLGAARFWKARLAS